MSHPVSAFADLASAFIASVDCGPYPLDLAVLVDDLLRLYVSAHAMPVATPEEDAPSPPSDLERRLTPGRLPPEALPFDYYWVALDPLESGPADLGCAQLFADILSVRDDLALGMWLWEAGWPQAAAWTWRFD